MHSCPECDQACYCDMDDTDMGECDDCLHECDEPGVEEYEADVDEVANAERDARV